MTKAKKAIQLFVVVVLCVCICFGLTFSIKQMSARAEENVEIDQEQREEIERSIDSILNQEGILCEKFAYSFADFYFANETWGGYVVDFMAGDIEGYAILFHLEGHLQIFEYKIGQCSPYYSKPGRYIYPSLGYYIIEYNDTYYDAETWALADYEPETDIRFYASCSNGKGYETVTKEINYTRGEYISGEISNLEYQYSTNLSDKKNNCANCAGVILLNYWNKYYSNDILHLDDNAVVTSNVYRWNFTDETAKKYMDIFYDYMNTNWFLGAWGGTRPNDAYNGFERLIKENGYRVSRKTNLTYDDMVSKIREGTPIMITSEDYYFSSSLSIPIPEQKEGSHTISIKYNHYSGVANSHTFIGFGFMEHTLYDENGNVFQQQFIKAANGWNSYTYFNMSISKVYDSAAIDVFK